MTCHLAGNPPKAVRQPPEAERPCCHVVLPG